MTDNDNVSRRRFLQATGGAATAAALAGCSGSSDTTTEDTTTSGTTTDDGESGSSDKTYRMTNSTITTLDPVASTDEASAYLIHQLYDTLTVYPNAYTTAETFLATGYDLNDDSTVLTFNLKEDVTFHDGSSFTASDMVYSWERLAASDSSRRASFLLNVLGVTHETNDDGSYVSGSLGVEAVDQTTFRVELNQPFYAALEMMAYDPFAAQKEGYVGDIDGYGGEVSQSEYATESPMGTGPFTLGKWTKGTEATLERYDDFHGETANVAGVHFQIVEKTNAQYTYATKNVNADHPYVPSSKYDSNKITIEGTDENGHPYGTYGPLVNDMTADYYRTSELTTYYYAFNTDEVIKPARQAFAYAFSARQMVNTVFGRPYKPAYFFLPPGLYPGGASAYNEAAQDYPYGYGENQAAETMLQKAREVMEDAGYSEDNKYEFTMTSYQSQTWSEETKLMRDKLASCHIKMNYEQVPFATLTERGRNGNLEGYTLGWGADYPGGDNFLQLMAPQFSQVDQDNAVSYTNWEGTDAAETAREAWNTITENYGLTEEAQQARAEAYVDMEKANWEDAVFINCFHVNAEHMSYPWVDKPRVGPMGTAATKFNQVSIGDRGQYE
ncbi:ABC transporter substrate-binding protein [Salarchaeum japonicum]|uniref:Solute-binding protein family 5 domain-containing protein n=1 Tax=Salarchaeum japonicum TaxID=555573 RepID=A0AAV3T010_9EURY|nr:ABC transporter substrate-binding protein [Salarchaeum japonicum]